MPGVRMQGVDTDQELGARGLVGLRAFCHFNPVLGALAGSQSQGGPETCACAAGVGRDQGEILACIYMAGDSNQI